MSELAGMGRFTFKDGHVEEFKRLSERCMEIVREEDRGTLQYDIFLSDVWRASVARACCFQEPTVA